MKSQPLSCAKGLAFKTEAMIVLNSPIWSGMFSMVAQIWSIFGVVMAIY